MATSSASSSAASLRPRGSPGRRGTRLLTRARSKTSSASSPSCSRRIPTDLMLQAGQRSPAYMGAPGRPRRLYEALTVWVMAAWPELPLSGSTRWCARPSLPHLRCATGDWTTRRLSDVVRKAGRRQDHREVHRHLGRPVSLVSLDAVEFEVGRRSAPAAAGSALRWVETSSPTCGWRSVSTTTWSLPDAVSWSWIATRTSPLTTSTPSRPRAPRPSVPQGLCRPGRCSPPPGPPRRRTSRTGSPTCSATCRTASAVALSHLLLGTDRTS